MSMDSNFYKEIIKKLDGLTKREYSFYSLLGVQLSLIIGISALTIFSFLELIFHFSSTVRTILFFIFLILFIGSILFLFINPLLKYLNIFNKKNHFETALKVGKNFPNIKDDLLNAMQLVTIDSSKNFYSSGLINAAFKNIYNRTKEIQFESIISFKKAKELFYYLCGVIVLCAILFLSVPNLQAAANRIVKFNQEFIAPKKFSFIITPGNSKVTKGDNLLISVKVKGELPKNVDLNIKHEDETDFNAVRLFPDSTGNFEFNVNAVRNSFKYFASAENINSDQYDIDVINPPIIKTLHVIVNSPSYSKIPDVELRDNGNVTALVGSKINLNITSTKELKFAELIFADTTKIPLEIKDKDASGSFKIKKDNSYKIIITDKNNNKNLSPITYTVKALYDSYPIIDIIEPNKDVTLANDNRLPLYLNIADDYGFSKLVLNYRLSESQYNPAKNEFSIVEIPIDKNNNDQEVNYIWNLTNLNLTTQDVVTYFLEVFDNDFVSGPKSTKSPSFTVRVPTLEEVLSHADQTQNQAVQDLQETLKQAQELKKSFDKIDEDLKKNDKQLTWEDKEKMQSALDKFEKLHDKVKDIKEQIQKSQHELQQNNLLSKETMEKYQELQKLMDEFTNDEMKNALEKLRNNLQNLNRQMTQSQMENFKIDEEQFQKSIERTMNLLKRIQIEQKMDELVKRTEELNKKINEIQKETKQSDLNNQNEKNKLSSEQNKVSKDLDELKDKMKELSDKMNDMKDMPKDQMDKIRENYDKQQNQKLSKNAQQNIQNNQQMQAQQMQSQLSQNMKEMSKQMQDMQNMMMQQNQMQTFKSMMKILDNLIALSKKQESLKNQSSQMNYNSSAFDENAKKQNELQRNLNSQMQQLSELSQKTFAITPEMGKQLGDAQRRMSESIESLQARNSGMSALKQGNAMESLNKAAALMKGKMESMMQQGGGSGGMMSLMQQLQQLSGQQMNLNNMTQMLRQMQNGQMSMQQQAQLQRLAQQQELIRKSMDQLNKEAKVSGESKKIPANLDNIVKQMQEVVTDMNTQKLDDNLIQKQERILSKMLDAQKSINERDYEKQRESNSGKNYVRQSPADLNLSNEQGKNKIVDELNKAVQEGYTKDYEELIRKYYEALQKSNN